MFDKQFELLKDKVEDQLNLRIFSEYLKGPKGIKDKRLKSLLDVISELDSLG